MKILSLFDGISCARVALERAGIPVEAYYASEIDKYAKSISRKNYLDILQMGSVERLSYKKEQGYSVQDDGVDIIFGGDIDLMIGGSPCQDLSIAKAGRKGLSGERSGLFFEYVRIFKEVQPKYFVLENVASMSKEARDTISETLGVQPIMIDAALVSAQQRKRYFWTNIPGVILPEDKGIILKDILEDGDVDRLKSYCIDASYYKGANWKQYKERGRRQLVKIGAIGKDSMGTRVYSENGISKTLSANGGGWGAKTGLYLQNDMIRKLTPIECERLQGLPDNYTEGISNTQRYKCLGNAFNVDVVAHILSFIPK